MVPMFNEKNNNDVSIIGNCLIIYGALIPIVIGFLYVYAVVSLRVAIGLLVMDMCAFLIHVYPIIRDK
jgi:hypothetical protein